MSAIGKLPESRNAPRKNRARGSVRVRRYLRESRRRGLIDKLRVYGMVGFGFFTTLVAVLHVGYRSRDWVWTPATKVLLAGMLISLALAVLAGLLGTTRDAIKLLGGHRGR